MSSLAGTEAEARKTIARRHNSVYNGAGHLSEAVDSLLKQTLGDFEGFSSWMWRLSALARWPRLRVDERATIAANTCGDRRTRKLAEVVYASRISCSCGVWAGRSAA